MKILKYKYVPVSKYKISFDEDEVILYEDVILKYNILLKKDVTSKELEQYKIENQYYELCYDAIKYLKRRMRSIKEMRIYLKKISDREDYINKVIDELVNKKILDDGIYAVCYVNDAINLKNIGPNKIKSDLINLGVDTNIVDNALSSFTDEMIFNKIKKYIDKELRINKKSSYMFRNKMLSNLMEKGYSKDDILKYLNTIFVDDSLSYQREYDKLYKKLSSKYSGSVLEAKIREKMYAKGFRK